MDTEAGSATAGRAKGTLTYGTLLGIAISAAWLAPPTLIGLVTVVEPNGWLAESDAVFAVCVYFALAGALIVPGGILVWARKQSLHSQSIALLTIATFVLYSVIAAAAIIGIVSLDSIINPLTD